MTQHNWNDQSLWARARFKPSQNSGGTQTVSSQTQVKLPQWVQNAATDVWTNALQTSNNLIPTYTGPRVADLTPQTLGLINAVQGNVGSTNPAFEQAQGVAQRASTYDLPTDYSRFLNPYTQSVIDPTIALLNQQKAGALNQSADQAIKTGSFAGSRDAITRAVLDSQYGMQGAQLAGQLNSQNYEQAVANAMANQQFNLQGAGALANLAQQGQQSFLTGAGAAQAGQNQITQNQQDKLNAMIQQYKEQQQLQRDPLGIQVETLRSLPYGQESNTNTTGPGPSSSGFLTGLGGGLAGLGIVGQGLSLLNPATAAGGGLAALLAGGGTSIPGLMSGVGAAAGAVRA